MLNWIETTTSRAQIADGIAEQIRRMILDSIIPSGERLPTESELMKRFGVSRSSVREAIKILQTEHIVEIRRGKGTYVTENRGVGADPLGLRFSEQTQNEILGNLMEARALIEPEIAYTAAMRRTDQQVKDMEALLDEMDSVHLRGEDYTPYDCRFHAMIAECTQNKVFSRLIPIINDSITAAVAHTVHVAGSYQRGARCHRLLLESINLGNPDAAKEAAQKHIKQSLLDWDDIIS